MDEILLFIGDMNMFDGLIAAIIAVVGVFAGISFNYKDMYNGTITKTRIDSLNNLRERTSRIIAKCKKGIKDNEKEKLYEDIYYVKMCMSIHPEREGNEYHYPLCNELDKIIKIIDRKSKIKIDNKIITNIENISKNIFDYEWRNIKKESKKGGLLC